MDGSQLLILTNSLDITVDRLIRRIGGEHIFRFNFDTWQEYHFGWNSGGFWLKNPTGRQVREADIAKCLWRKPISRFRLDRDFAASASGPRRFMEAEVDAFLIEMKNQLWQSGKVVLIEPDSRERVGKFCQLRAARKYFTVPDWVFCHPLTESTLQTNDAVVKSITGERVEADKGLWTTAVDASMLDEATPWFMQERVDSDADVTVAYVRGESFAFALDRRPFKDRTLDWREMGNEVVRSWQPVPIAAECNGRIHAFMAELGLHYGRLDFLEKDGEWLFLEVNANGEWDWLDADKGRGLFERIVETVDPRLPVIPLPVAWR